MPTSPDFVNQKALARELGIVDRRVRQMVAEHLLPPAREGRYRLSTCKRWTDLYRRGSAREWLDFYAEIEDQLAETDKRFAAAFAPTSSKVELRAAGLAVQDLYEMLRFTTAAKSESAAERAFTLAVWKEGEDESLRQLLGRAMELIAAERGVPVEQLRYVDEAA